MVSICWPNPFFLCTFFALAFKRSMMLTVYDWKDWRVIWCHTLNKHVFIPPGTNCDHKINLARIPSFNFISSCSTGYGVREWFKTVLEARLRLWDQQQGELRSFPRCVYPFGKSRHRNQVRSIDVSFFKLQSNAFSHHFLWRRLS